MTGAGETDLDRIRAVAVRLQQIRHMLMRPEPKQIGACGPVLEEAVGLLSTVGRGQELMNDLYAVKRELTAVAALMQQAAGYYLGWAQMLGAATGGYTRWGEAAPLTSAPRLSIEG